MEMFKCARKLHYSPLVRVLDNARCWRTDQWLRKRKVCRLYKQVPQAKGCPYSVC